MGRGGAILRTKIKNLVNGSLLEKTFKGNDKIEEADL
jgi:translation elongation factor P/translation initiation factor 5A